MKSSARARFQSSLDPRGPSVAASAAGWRVFRKFQSSLDPRGPSVRGRKGVSAIPTGFNPRSTLAGRASFGERAAHADQRSFNPRSTLAGRASGALLRTLRVDDVSILARPSRAERPDQRPARRGGTEVSILARPSRAERPPEFSEEWVRWTGFNPRSTLAGRASSSRNILASHPRSFNPRSTLAGRASSTLL